MTMVDPVATVESEVRELVRRRGLDPLAQPQAIRSLVAEVLADYDERTMSGALPALSDPGAAAQSVFDSVAGYGPLQPYLDDPSVEELWINEPGRVFVARSGRSELTTVVLTSDEVRDLVERMLKASNRRVDLSQPFVDAMLHDGSRLHVAVPDITRRHWAVNIRKFVVKAGHLDDLVGLGHADPAGRRLPRGGRGQRAQHHRRGRHAGGQDHAAELSCSLQSRPTSASSRAKRSSSSRCRPRTGSRCRPGSRASRARARFGLRRLVKEALRMRPSRIVGRRSPSGRVPRPAHRPQQRGPRHVQRSRQQRP